MVSEKAEQETPVVHPIDPMPSFYCPIELVKSGETGTQDSPVGSFGSAEVQQKGKSGMAIRG